jgi:hypothetical protein
MALFLNGAWESVVLDSRFSITVNPEGEPNAWAMATNRDKKGIWVMLLEKDWEKVHGGYLNTNAGFTTEFMNALNGAPEGMYYLKDPKGDEEPEKEVAPAYGGEEDGLAWKTDRDSKPKDRLRAWEAIYNPSKLGLIMCTTSRDLSVDGKDDKDEATGIVGTTLMV